MLRSLRASAPRIALFGATSILPTLNYRHAEVTGRVIDTALHAGRHGPDRFLQGWHLEGAALWIPAPPMARMIRP